MNACTALYVDDSLSVTPILRALAAEGYTLLAQDGKLIITQFIPGVTPCLKEQMPTASITSLLSLVRSGS